MRIKPKALFRLTLDEVGVIYAVVLLTLSHVFVLPDFIGSFLALPLMVIVPLLTGNLLIKTIRRILSFDSLRSIQESFSGVLPSDKAGFLTVSWLIGCHLLATMYLLLTFLRLPAIVANLPLLVLVVAIPVLLFERRNSLAGSYLRVPDSRFMIAGVLIVTISTLMVAMTRTFTPFPTTWGRLYFLLTWNVQAPERIVFAGFFTGSRWPNLLFPAISLTLAGTDPLAVMWSQPFLMAAFYGIGVFLFILAVTKNVGLAALTASISLFLHSSPTRNNPLILIGSSPFMMVVLPFILYAVYNKMQSEDPEPKEVLKIAVFLGISLLSLFLVFKRMYTFERSGEWSLFFESALLPMWMIILPLVGVILSLALKRRSSRSIFLLTYISCSILFFMHNDETILYTSVIVLFMCIHSLVKMRIGYPLIVALATVTFLFVLLQWFDIVNIIESNLISQYWLPELSSADYDVFDRKRADFLSTYSEITILLVLLGCTATLASKKQDDKLMIGTFSAIVLVFFLPELQAFRLLQAMATFMAYILARAVFWMLAVTSAARFKKPYFNHTVPTLVVILLLVVVTPSLVVPTYDLARRLADPVDNYSYCTIADYEYEAAFWLDENFQETTMIVSDFRTMLILSSLSNRIWLTGKGMSGLESSPESEMAMQVVKEDVFGANSSSEAYDVIFSLPQYMHIKELFYMEYVGISTDDLSFIVILSSRTVEWIKKENLYDVVHAQYSEVPVEFLDLFEDETYFDPIHSIGNTLYMWVCNE